MNHHATTARANSQHCEAKKHALRQTQDGIVVAFVLHPNDVPPSLQLAPLGTRYMLALVEIADDETPAQPRKVVMPAARESVPVDKSPAPGSDTPVRAHRAWRDMPFSQQAAIRLHEPSFVKFLADGYGFIIGDTFEDADGVLKELCNVKSKRELLPNTNAGERWQEIDDAYLGWMAAPVVGVE